MKSTVHNDRYNTTINTVEIRYMKAQILEIEKPFKKAQQRFEQLSQKLESTSVLSMTHSEVECCIQEWLCYANYDHLDLRTLREEKSQAVLGLDGIQRLPNRTCNKILSNKRIGWHW